MTFKNSEQMHQFINFLMVFVDVEEKPDFRFVLNDGTVAFIGFDDEPFSLSDGRISYFSLFDNRS